ncbi:MAG: hypothetical protein GX660_20900 [Clostridiaceae bacterium]|nr:hypothetical protein [Clostridiaceae bacterium]
MLIEKNDSDILFDYLSGKISDLPLNSSRIAADVDRNKVLNFIDVSIIFATTKYDAKERPDIIGNINLAPGLSDTDTLAYVSIGSAYGLSGDTVNVSIEFEKVPAVGVAIFGFCLKYDSDVMEFVSRSEYNDIEVDVDELGNIRVIKNSGEIILKDKVKIAELEFKIKKNAKPGSYEIEAISYGMGSVQKDKVVKINDIYYKGKVIVSSSAITSDVVRDDKTTPSDSAPEAEPKSTPEPAPKSTQEAASKSTPEAEPKSTPEAALKSTPEAEQKSTPKPTTESTPTPTSPPTSLTPTATSPQEIIEPYTPIPGISFTDITGHWAKDNLIRLKQKGLISGYEEGTIRPDKTITRNETAIVLVKLMGIEPPITSPNIRFNDKAAIPEWVKPSLGVVINYGLMDGFEDNTFRGNENLTRAQAAVVLIKILNQLEGRPDEDVSRDLIYDKIGTYKDFSENYWANMYLYNAINYGLMTGYGDKTLKPNNNVTRAEFFTMCSKLLDLFEE